MLDPRYNVCMNLNETSTHRPPSVTFLGAAQSVSGSMHLLQTGSKRFLFDCGSHRGPRNEARARNAYFAFDPTTISALFLSHAHVDHCGNIPNLVRQGFNGPIYCTHATKDLVQIMLEDSLRIQEADASAGRGFSNRGRTLPPPLFTREHVEKAIENCVGIDFQKRIQLDDNVELEMIDSGHILGSAITCVSFTNQQQRYSVTFTGDLGRRGIPYLPDPSPVPAADLIICESTYGGKRHDTLEGMAAKMAKIVSATIERGGKVLIPAFSLGRTQLVLHYLRTWMAQGVVPTLPLYVDSPLAQLIDTVYEKHRHLVQPTRSEISCRWLETEEEAWECTSQRAPCIIVASGGMCEGGRIVRHLTEHIDDPRSTIVLVSYQAPDSVGAQMLSSRPTVKMQGQNWNKWIEVAEINGFSGHADKDDMEVLLRDAVDKTGKVRLVHGEIPQMAAMTAQLREMGFADVAAPRRNETVFV